MIFHLGWLLQRSAGQHVQASLRGVSTDRTSGTTTKLKPEQLKSIPRTLLLRLLELRGQYLP